MTDDELFAAVDQLDLGEAGYVQYFSFESTNNMPEMIELAKARIRANLPGADTQREVLLRVLAYSQRPA
ncbi:hypothetical protein [Fibrella aestuarina]|uniref:hypothetical protein n=1 Tax=Fibrella aestuarina TaxID=651143 RepID=UPI0011D281BF|nr:hypothetical protein [Fibrella aestuarina]